MKVIRGDLETTGLRFGIAAARWNQSVTDRLLDGALERLEELGIVDVTVLRVPGALEVPLGIRSLIEHGCNAAVAIGVVIKGDTDHYEIVVRDSTMGVSRLTVDTGVPVGNAILAVHDVEDAIERSGDGDSNKGREAVDAAVETANAIRKLSAD